MLKRTAERDPDAIRHIGYDLLGPVVHRWLLALDQHMGFLDDGGTAFLLCARAGHRIGQLFDIYLQETTRDAPKAELFWISRLAVCKGTVSRHPSEAVAQLSREYAQQPLGALVAGLTRHHPERARLLKIADAEETVRAETVCRLLRSRRKPERKLTAYLAACGTAFDAYLAGLLKGRKRAVLIDSGWQGSAQSLLAAAYPEIAWKGLYFGRILPSGHDRTAADAMIGLMFERDAYDPAVPESAFVRHRHLIETLLEPNGSSIEEIPGGPCAAVAKRMIQANLDDQPDPERDALYLHVIAYLRENCGGASLASIVARHQEAMAELARVIVRPTRAEARALVCKSRSADFGKTLDVPVLVEPEGHDPADADRRIAEALWPEGQVALEYEGEMARDLQARLTGEADPLAYFDPNGEAGYALPAVREQRHSLVAVITRTKNRPLLLRRAAESVARQTYPNFEWIVVNDGGDTDAVRAVIDEAPVDRRRITLIDNSRSLGMEAASNAGIRNSLSDYVVIHDDDDSWTPDFLARTVRFLDGPAGARYGGVVTHSVYVSEEIRGNTVVEHERTPYMDWVRNVQLAEMACGNLFPPIAFLFRRSVWEQIGGYNEDLPVLGDWYFNLEFLMQSDIAVIAEPLAHYHHRDRADGLPVGAYANSVIGGVSKHEEFAAVARNAFLRKHAGTNPAALAVISGYMAGDLRQRMPAARASGSGRAELDLADRYWVAAQANKMLARKRGGLFGRTGKILDPVASWPEIAAFVRSARLEIPPPANFDDDLYLSENADVAEVFRSGGLKSGFQHYVLHGRQELRNRPTRS